MNAEMEQQIRAFALGRISLGAAALIAPGTVVKRLLGKDNVTPVTRTMARFLGGRDVALGLGALFALSHGAPVRGWIEAGMVADAGDLVGALLSGRHLPRGPLLTTIAGAAGGIVFARRLVSRLEQQGHPAQPTPPEDRVTDAVA